MLELSTDLRPWFFDTLCELVRIPSRSSPHGGEEGAVQAHVAQCMRALGADVRVLQVDDVPEFYTHPLCMGPQRQYANRPTIIGTIGPAAAPALLVCAHSDTVPLFEPELWTHDPFDPWIADGNIHGLGVGDDKWGVAALLAMLRSYMESGRPLRKRLIFATTIDEEHGVGNGLLLLALAGIKAQAALYLDGMDTDFLLGHLGGSHFTLRPRASLGDADIAAHTAALDAACREISAPRAALFEEPLLRDNVMRHESVNCAMLRDAQGPYVVVRFYTVEGEDGEQMQRELEAMIRGTLGEAFSQYDMTLRYPWFEPARTDPATPLMQHLTAAYRQVMGREPRLTRGSKQDAFVLNNHAGIPTISYGPGRSQMPGRYHAPDEFINMDIAWDALRVAHDAVWRWVESD